MSDKSRLCLVCGSFVPDNDPGWVMGIMHGSCAVLSPAEQDIHDIVDVTRKLTLREVRREIDELSSDALVANVYDVLDRLER